ncbi:ATPase AAA-2 domain protein [Acetobacter orientalis]|uniref:ATPase AAA-2 domain protein n=1 Tax=Acetobacter orientalis TaxID=146474 RepID=A0A2Z5ZJK0_9PROT|nr:ATPase AAA-2 domain protein [Acetobacter orientalis]
MYHGPYPFALRPQGFLPFSPIASSKGKPRFFFAIVVRHEYT